MQANFTWRMLVVICTVIGVTSAATFWQITDVHVDDNYTATGIEHSYCHRDSSAPSRWFGHNGCGLPWRTVQSAVDLMRRQHSTPDFIVWTGDTAPYWPYPDWSHVFPKLRRVTQMLREAFPETPILPAIGNHDAYPSDQLPDANATFYSEYLRRSGWADVLDVEAQRTFARGGYYVASPSDRVRVLVLNTNLYYAKNGAASHTQDSSGQLAWLSDTLQQLAEDESRPAVLISGHIAPGFAHWDDQQPAILASINRRLLDAMTAWGMDRRLGHVFGHEHIDTFKAAAVSTSSDEALGLLVAPAVYPGSGPIDTNPAVRLYSYSADQALLQDYQQFHLDLDAANAAHRQSPQTDPLDFWRQTYRATRLYNVSDLSVASLVTMATQLRQNRRMFDVYWNMTNGGYKHRSCGGRCFAKRACIITSVTSPQMDLCRRQMNPVSADAGDKRGATMLIVAVALLYTLF